MLKCLGGPDDRHTLSGVCDPLHGHLQPEPVQELRPEFALFGVHGADKDEPGRVREGYPLPLNNVDTHGGGVEEDIGHMVVEQVDLIDVEYAAVDRREDPGIDGHRAFPDRPLHVDGSHHPILGHPEREVDDADPAPFYLQVFTPRLFSGAGGAHTPIPGGIAVVGAALDDVYLREQIGKRPDSGGLGRPLLAADEHSADPGVDGVEDECAFHRLLAADGGEREDVPLCLI